MGSVLNRSITGSTANAGSYASNAFTPTAGDLLQVTAHVSGSIETAPTISASANGITFTMTPLRLEQTLSGHVSFIWVADQKVGASPGSMTVTVGVPNDAGTGCFIEVTAITGMTKVGSAAILQSALAANIASSNPWTATFTNPTDTNNPLYGFLAYATGGQTVVPPSGWTQLVQPADQSAPAIGYESAKADSGQTSTSYTWTGTSSPSGNTRANLAVIEYDISSGGGGPTPYSGWGIPL